MHSRGVSQDVSPSPTTAQLLLLVSSLREESTAAHNLLEKYRLLLVSTRLVMERRIPERVTRAKVINTHDKAAIEVIVAEVNRLEKLYSPHMVPADGDGRVQGPPCVDKDVRGPEGDRGRDDGPLRVDDGNGRVQGSFRGDEGDVLRLRRERGHKNGSPYPAIDWDNLAKVSFSHGSLGLQLPQTTSLPVIACKPGPTQDAELENTYNPTGGKYTPPPAPHLTTTNPFGQIEGFRTNLGPISFPKGPVKGYILDQDHRWVLHATPPGVRRRGARGLRR